MLNFFIVNANFSVFIYYSVQSFHGDSKLRAKEPWRKMSQTSGFLFWLVVVFTGHRPDSFVVLYIYTGDRNHTENAKKVLLQKGFNEKHTEQLQLSVDFNLTAEYRWLQFRYPPPATLFIIINHPPTLESSVISSRASLTWTPSFQGPSKFERGTVENEINNLWRRNNEAKAIFCRIIALSNLKYTEKRQMKIAPNRNQCNRLENKRKWLHNT